MTVQDFTNKRHTNPDKYVYTKLVSKNSSGMYKKQHSVVACTQAVNAALYSSRLYFSKMPQEAFVHHLKVYLLV